MANGRLFGQENGFLGAQLDAVQPEALMLADLWPIDGGSAGGA